MQIFILQILTYYDFFSASQVKSHIVYYRSRDQYLSVTSYEQEILRTVWDFSVCSALLPRLSVDQRGTQALLHQLELLIWNISVPKFEVPIQLMRLRLNRQLKRSVIWKCRRTSSSTPERMKKLGMNFFSFFFYSDLFSVKRRNMEYKQKLTEYLYEFSVFEKKYVTVLMENAGYGFVQVS